MRECRRHVRYDLLQHSATFLWAILLLISLVRVASAECLDDEVLVGEDDRNWYCDAPEPPETIAGVLNGIDPHFLGSEWRFRKAVIDTVGSLTRPPGKNYLFGGKLRFESGGRVVWMCVAKNCAGQVAGGIDCSGFVEYGATHAACFVRGMYSLAGLAVSHMIGSAADQAAYFRSHGAFSSSGTNAHPGDFIFFRHTTKTSKANDITHVGIFLRRDRDGKTLIIHASSAHGRALFDWLEPDSFLGQRIAGYGDISILTPTR